MIRIDEREREREYKIIIMILGKFLFTWKCRGLGYWTCFGPNTDRLAARSQYFDWNN